MFHKVIVGFDGSEHARDAHALGAVLTAPGGELIVCCVHHLKSLSARVDPTEPRLDRAAAERCAEEATGLVSSVAVNPILVAGAGVAIALQHTAKQQHADLIVLGSSHRGALGRVFVGSVTAETLHAARCPVAVSPVGFRDHSEGTRLARIAVGHDVVEPTPDTLSAGVELCEQTGAELLLVAVAEDAAVDDPERATMSYAEITEARLHAAEQVLAEALRGLPESISATSEVRDGDPAEQLLEVTHDADLMVLGSHGRGTMGRLIMGSVCDRVMRAAACAVLVVPPSKSSDVAGTTRLSPAISSAHGS
jgi:nucleotide-binding universal stress UspA family protein